MLTSRMRLTNARTATSLLRVAAADYRRADGKRVHTVRDVIIEVDPNGDVVDDWALWDILDPYRDNVIKALDQGAVCLNIDADEGRSDAFGRRSCRTWIRRDNFGDIAGCGPGPQLGARQLRRLRPDRRLHHHFARVISPRIIKIGRDKQVKWILGFAGRLEARARRQGADAGRQGRQAH